MNVLAESDILFIEKFIGAFKTLGGEESGLIDYDRFKSVCFKKYGDDFKEMLLAIDAENCLDGNNLNFMKLCSAVLSTKAAFNKISTENGRLVTSGPRINTHTFTRKKATSKSQLTNGGESTISKQRFTHQICGALYNVNDDLLSNHYQLEMLENADVQILVKEIASSVEELLHKPVELFILQDKTKGFITCSSFMHPEGFSSINVNLKKGKYVIVPVLLNWDVNKSPCIDNENVQSITEEGGGQLVLTPHCVKALQTIFNCVDLDGNKLLSQLEFDLFIQHTSGETAADEWSTIEDNFKMQDGQLTFDGFLELYKMVLQTDPSDVFNMFQRMGMNDALQQVNAQPFSLMIKSGSSKFTVKPLPVSSYSVVAEKIFRKVTVERGYSSKVRNMNDLVLYTHKLLHRATIVVQNQSHSKVTVRLDCSKSQNCHSHRKSLDYSIQISPRTSVVGHHLFPTDIKHPWNIVCIESLY